MSQSCLITGATGFVGSHLAEACLAKGWTVRALVRAGSDTRALEKAGVKLLRGELTDAPALEAGDGVDVVFHCAARVGDWGPIDEYRAVNVEGLRGLLEACKNRPLKRFVLVDGPADAVQLFLSSSVFFVVRSSFIAP